MTVLDKVTALCCRQGFAIPVECMLNNAALTCYSYGPLGALFRRNIIQEWWRSLLITHANSNIYTVHNSPLIAHNAVVPGDQRSEGGQPILRNSLTNGLSDYYLSTLAMSAGRRQLPFGLAQQGTCWNSPGTGCEDKQKQFLFSSDEYEELVLHYFIPPAHSLQAMDQWVHNRLRWWKKFSGSPSDFTTVDLQQGSNNASDNNDTAVAQEVHIQYKFPWGSDTIETLCNHGDGILWECHGNRGISPQAQHGSKTMVPHQLECKMMAEKAALVYLLDAYTEREQPASGTQNIILQLHPLLAPYKVALMTLGSKCDREGREVSDHVCKELRQAGITVLDLHNSHSRDVQLRKYDEMGVPWVVIVNDRTLETGIVQLRHRTSSVKEKVSLTKLKSKILLYSRAPQEEFGTD